MPGVIFVAEDVDQVSAVSAGLHDFVDLVCAGVVGEELLHEACDLGSDFSKLKGHVALFFAEPAEFGVATVWRWSALGHVVTVGGGPVVGEWVRYGGCAGRWMARGAAGRDRRPRRTPGRRAAEGRVRRCGAPPLDTYKNNSASVRRRRLFINQLWWD